MKITELIRPNIKKLVPYSSARDEYSGKDVIQLDANENAYLDQGLSRYPDPYQKELKAEIAKGVKASVDQLILGNGSDEIIDLLIRTFCIPGTDNVVSVKPSYGMYKVSCDINDVSYEEVPLDSSFQLDAEKVLNQVNERTKLIFLCSPNNPSGNILNSKEVSRILNEFNGLVVLDEAYIDFADSPSWVNRLDEFSNLFVMQTFSKSYGLAGIRIGMGWGTAELVSILNKVKPPYNINALSQKEALNAIREKAKIEDSLSALSANKQALQSELNELALVEKIYPSDANFFLVKFQNAQKVYDYLLLNKIVVRNRSNQFNCEGCLRITVGSESENKELIKYLKQL